MPFEFGTNDIHNKFQKEEKCVCIMMMLADLQFHVGNRFLCNVWLKYRRIKNCNINGINNDYNFFFHFFCLTFRGNKFPAYNGTCNSNFSVVLYKNKCSMITREENGWFVHFIAFGLLVVVVFYAVFILRAFVAFHTLLSYLFIDFI